MAVIACVAFAHILDILFDDENDDMVHVEMLGMHSILREDRTRCRNYFEEVIPNYLPDEFRLFFKVCRGTIELICQSIANYPELSPRCVPGGREPIPLGKKVLITIRYLSSQETIHELSDRFGVTPFSVLHCIRNVISSINNTMLNRFVKWPENRELPEISQRFNDLGQHEFPSVVGAIDGCHVQIEAPYVINPKSYFNRKKNHSVILQEVCTYDMRFIDINVGWPGRVHDAKVLRNSRLWESGFHKCENGRYHLLGDAAYPLKEWLLTPYRDNGHLTRQQLSFNMRLSSKRQVIERAFAQLKGRFRRLKYVNIKSVEEICKAVLCACILHNVCIIEADSLEDMLLEENQVPENYPGMAVLQNDAQGQLKRLNITQRI
ncbi:protein ALP1-like [Pecten maximus]|uniref:protein ALP1-like n=1 Tax=Pecten maximus TaxID=6579 RepID=UPI001458C6FC|nr:protein ALP1-like [Pecten maximus]